MEKSDIPVTRSASGINRPAVAALPVALHGAGSPKEGMDFGKVSGLNGLHYRKESYFDFVVSDRPKYTPGCGPALAPISALLPHDQDGFIIEKALIEKELVYIVGYEDNSNVRVSVKAQNILNWVSPRTYEQWESDEYDRRVREEEERELPGILAREAAKRKRLEKSSREGGPKIDGRKKKRKAMHMVGTEVDSDNPRKKGRRGRPPKQGRGLLDTTPGSGRKTHPQTQMFTSPRRLSQHSNQPSLSTPNRGLADVINLDSETDEDDEDEDTDVEQVLADQLNGRRDSSLSNSSRSSSLFRNQQYYTVGTPGSHKRRRSLIGGDRGNATAATSALDAFKVYESIEKSHKKEDKSIYLDRSPFKRKPSMFASPKQNINTSFGRTLSETRSMSRQKSATPLSAKDLLRRSVREASTPTPPPTPSEEGEADADSAEAEYEVEAITADEIRVVNGKKIHYYRVRWVGYSEADDTWEPMENVGKSNIRQYEKVLREQERDKERGRESSGAWQRNPGDLMAPVARMS